MTTPITDIERIEEELREVLPCVGIRHEHVDGLTCHRCEHRPIIAAFIAARERKLRAERDAFKAAFFNDVNDEYGEESARNAVERVIRALAAREGE